MKPWTFLDKILWQFMRWATKFSVRPLMFIGITPNQLTTLSSIINFSAASFCFAQGTFKGNLVGLAFLFLHSYFDFADGALARATAKTGRLGSWLDSRLDVIGAEAVIVGIAIGVIQVNLSLLWLSIAALAIFGRLGVLAVVFDYERAIFAGPEFWQKFRQDKKMTFIDKLIKEFITLESFPFLFLGTFRYFLTLMVVLNQVKLFLLVSAVFNNLRWLIMFWAHALAISEQERKPRSINLLAQYFRPKEEETK